MSNTRPIYDNEIDLLNLMETVWDGKWKIVSIMSLCLLSAFGYKFLFPNLNFDATTSIRPITSFELDKYRLFNSSLKIIEKENKIKEEKNVKDEKDEKEFNIFEITKNSLLNLYIENIEEGSLLEEGINKFNLIDRKNFTDENKYKSSVIKFASEIEIVVPEIDQKLNKDPLSNKVITGQYHNKKKWLQLITFINYEANKRVKDNLTERFETIINVQKQKVNFAIKDIEVKIDNVKKDYEIITKNKIAFLSEQAKIARELEIKNNTISSQRFSTENTLITNFKTDTPFYLRGYKAIEAEINQIKNRKDKSAFNDELLDLEKEIRKLKQNQILTRAKELFLKTPLNQKGFKATIVKPEATKFVLNKNDNLFYALAVVLGGLIGVIYVLLSKAFNNRKKLLANP